MIRLVVTILTEIENGYRKLQSKYLGREVTVKDPQYASYGDDSSPIAGMKALRAELGNKGSTAIIGYLNTDALAAPGEKRLYSTDDQGNVQAFVWLKNDGQTHFNGTGDNLVRFSPIKASHDAEVDKINEIIQAWNNFANSYTPGGPSAVGTPPTALPVVELIDSIDDAKINELETTPP